MAVPQSIQYRATLIQSIAVIVGIVIGAGIFQMPPLVARFTADPSLFIGIWILGGVLSFAGALCYAELATCYPHEGGDYDYLRRAYGNPVAFLFIWSRLTVIQTGSAAMLAFILGSYATTILNLGPFSDAIYAALAIVFLTAYNCTGIKRGFTIQTILFGMVLTALAVVIVTGLTSQAPITDAVPDGQRNIGQALIFVLLTFGGWTEAAFISRELMHSPRTMVRALVLSIALITLVYLLANLAFLHYFGFERLISLSAIGAAMMNGIFGEFAANLFSLIIIVVAISSMNGVLMTGARSMFALGRDYPLFGRMAQLNHGNGNPVQAYLVQGVIALVLIAVGAVSRSGFEMMVDYTAPVFWLFIAMSTGSLMILRKRESGMPRPFTVPGYPVVPIVFMMVSVYLCYSGFVYAGRGGVIGLMVLASGMIAYYFAQRKTG